MKNPIEDAPRGAVAGLSEILLAIGDELRAANHHVGEQPNYGAAAGEPPRRPVLFLQGATVELAVSVSADASGGVRVWVLNADASTAYERSGKITIHLNTGARGSTLLSSACEARLTAPRLARRPSRYPQYRRCGSIPGCP